MSMLSNTMKLKFTLLTKINIAIGLMILIVAALFAFAPTAGKSVPKEPRSLEESAHEVLIALQARDMQKVSEFVHLKRGVRFSPYGTINTKTDLVFTAEKVRHLTKNPQIFTWGSYDGSGEPIQMTYSEYHQKFVMDSDFRNAPKKATNMRLGHGNTIDNIADVYPRATFIEYHFPGFDPQYEGMDWKSLRLVFEEKDGTWYLAGIIHDQWTI